MEAYNATLSRLTEKNLVYLFKLDLARNQILNIQVSLQEYIDSYTNGLFEIHSRHLYRVLSNIGLMNLNSKITATHGADVRQLFILQSLNEAHFNLNPSSDFLISIDDFFGVPLNGLYDIEDVFSMNSEGRITLNNKETLFLHLLSSNLISIPVYKERFFQSSLDYLSNLNNRSLDEVYRKNILISFLFSLNHIPDYIKQILRSSIVSELENLLKFYIRLRSHYTNNTLLTKKEIFEIKNKDNYEVFFNKYTATDILIRDLFNNLRLDH